LLPANGLMSSSEAATSSSNAIDVHIFTTIAYISLPYGSELGSTLHTEQEWNIIISSYTPVKEPGTHEAIILDDSRHRRRNTRSSAISSYSLDTIFWRFSGIEPTVMRTVVTLKSKTVVCEYSVVVSYVFTYLFL